MEDKIYDSLIGCFNSGGQPEDKRAQNSNTEVSSCTIIIHFIQCMTVISMAHSESSYAFPVSYEVSVTL